MDWSGLLGPKWVRNNGLFRFLFPTSNDDELPDPDAYADHGQHYESVVTPDGDLVAGPHFDAWLTPDKIFKYAPMIVWATVVTHQANGFTMWGLVRLEGFLNLETKTIKYNSSVPGGLEDSNNGRMLFSNHVATEWNYDRKVAEINGWHLPQRNQPFTRRATKGFLLSIEQATGHEGVYNVDLRVTGYRDFSYPATDIDGVLVSPLQGERAPFASGIGSKNRMLILISLRASQATLQHVEQ